MKTISALSLSLFIILSTSAQAGPNVGDFAKLEGVMVENRVSIPLTMIQKVTAFDGTIYNVEQTQIINSQSQVIHTQYAIGDLVTEDKAAEILSECEKGIGKLEKLKTKAGTLQTCRTESVGAKIWFAVVPFGVVKISTKTPVGRIDVSITEYGRGE